MSTLLGSAFWLLVTLGVLVTFHEFGHYWVARRCGVKVLRFSVGFGRAIWKRVARDGTEYWIAAIPLGGYVKMLDAREGEVDPALRDQEFTGKSVWKRIAIVAAGPAFNLLFAILAFWAMFVIGRPDTAPIVTATPHSMAADAGVRAGDRILSINGQSVTTFSDSMDGLANALLSREPTPLAVRDPDGNVRQLVLPLDRLAAGKTVDKYFDTLGLKSAPTPAVAANVIPGKPASLAGVKEGDRIVAVNGKPVADYAALLKRVPAEAAKSPHLTLSIERHGKAITVPVKAQRESLSGQPVAWVIGIGGPPPELVTLRYGPIRALGEAFDSTWRITRQTFAMIGEMITGRASAKNMSSVIGIAQYANASAQMGLAWFLSFLAMISLNLAILNLLPIPVLDGGHLLYYLVELVKGSPVSEKTMVVGQYIGLLLLFSLVGMTLFNDIHRIVLS